MTDTGKALRMYMGFDRNVGPEEGAVLIFAESAKQARKLAHPFVSEWSDGEWIDTAVVWLKDREHLRELAESETPHVIERIPVCPSCEQWGGVIENGKCSMCSEDTE